MKNVIKSIKEFNAGRNPELLNIKFNLMREDIFHFYRATCHLFAEDNHTQKIINAAPLTWICGDLHLENFGSYKGNNRAVCFDINDFDEAILAPCLWDVSRFLCSIIIAHKSLSVKKEEAIILADLVLKRYIKIISLARIGMIETETSTGIIRDMLEGLKSRKRKEFIDKRTERIAGKLKLKIDGIKTIAMNEEKKIQLKNCISNWAQSKRDKEFYEVKDIAIRIAGTSSLGIERYVILVEGKGKDNHYLLDMKLAMPSSLLKFTKAKQPLWNDDAERIIEIQKRMQAFSPALLDTLKWNKKYFVLKELQPTDDKLDLSLMNGKVEKLKNSLNSFADIIAWDQLRSCNQQGSAMSHELIDFVNRDDWQQSLLSFCANYTNIVKQDYEIFCAAFDDGEFSEEEEDAELIS
jgi:uncharacterized protein (DUF2252 family)